MKDPRHITTVAVFLLMVFGVPVSQAIFDLADDMTPQALDVFDLPALDDDLGFSGKVVQTLKDIMDGERLRDYEDALEENSLFEENGRYAFQFAAYLSTRALGEKATPGRDGWYFYTPGVKYLSEPYFRSPRSASFGKVDPLEAIVDFAAQLRARGIDLLVVPVPGKASVYPDKLTSALAPGADVFAHTTLLRQEIAASGIATYDLHADLIAARIADPDGERLYMLSDTHWSGAGIKIAARALASRIRRGGWASAPPETPRYNRTAIQVQRFGDVAEMTKIPGRESFFDDETVRVHQVRDVASGELYQDSDDSPIMWLGDSFSRVFQTDEPEAAGIIANLAYELQIPITSIVNDGGASTLVREQLARRLEKLDGKRVVIWEFIERDVRFGMKGWAKVVLDPDAAE